MLLLPRGGAPLAFDLFQRGNRLDIAPELFLGAALAQMVVHDTEVLRPGLPWLLLFGLRPFRLVKAHPLDDHIEGHPVPVAGMGGLGGDGHLWLFLRLWRVLCRCWLLHPQVRNQPLHGVPVRL